MMNKKPVIFKLFYGLLCALLITSCAAPAVPKDLESQISLENWVVAAPETTDGQVQRAVVAGVKAMGAQTDDMPPRDRLQELVIEPSAPADVDTVNVILELNANSSLDVNSFVGAHFKRSLHVLRTLVEVENVDLIELRWSRHERPMLMMTARRADLARIDLDDPARLGDLEDHLLDVWRYWQ